ncbi:MAG: NAD(P)/FAD-dependent oxidoreductase [Candidatus Aenigmatarchaeota archaeon]
MTDVIIIGSGPAGITCAKRLADSGLSVSVYDKRHEIGSPKRCGEAISESTQKLIPKIPDRCIAQKIRGSRMYAPNGKYLDAVVAEGGYILERKVFDKWLAEEAEKSGVKIQSSTFITELIKDDKGFYIGVKGEFLGENFEENAKVIVCATGAESPIRKQVFGVCSKIEMIDTCLQYEMTGVDVSPDNFLHIYMGNILAPRGYVWVFPKCNGRANVGVGIVPGEKKPKFYLDNFINSHPEIKKGSILEVNAGCVPVGGMVNDMVANGIVLCGEAANHVNPLHGGGIKEAIISGQLAADVIIECIKNNDVSKKALSRYNELWWESRGNMMRNIEKLREVIEKLSDDDLNDIADNISAEDIVEFTKGARLSALAKVLMRKPHLLSLAKHLL